MVTSGQIRAAMAQLMWSAEYFVNSANNGIAMIRRFKIQEDIPSMQIRIFEALKAAIEIACIKFIGSEQAGAGAKSASRQLTQNSLFAKQTAD